jgi:hypothetical protein
MTSGTWRLWAAIAVGLAGGLIIWVVRVDVASDDCLDLGSTESFPPNSVSFVPCVPAFVVHGIGSDFAVYPVHQRDDEAVHWDERRHLFHSKEGKKTYNLKGEPLSGVRSRALVRCRIRIENGRLRLAETPARRFGQNCSWRGVPEA